jgi:hypothetical protein
MLSNAISFLRDYLFTMPVLARFAVLMVLLVTIPRLSRRVNVPVPVGLLLSGVIVGPYVLDIFGTVRPVADFLAELGKLLLMFFAGLEIDLALFRRARHRSIALGIATTAIPLVLGTIVGLAFGYAAIPAIVIGSLLASHTLLGLSIVSRLGLGQPGAGDGSGWCHGHVRHAVARGVRHLRLDLHDRVFLRRVWRSCWPRSQAISRWSCSA